METESGNKKLGWVVAFLAVAVLVLGGLLYVRSEEKNALELEKQSLTIDLSEMQAELLSQMGANDSLNGFIQFETQRLGSMIDSINAINIQNKRQLRSYRNRLADIKKQNDALVAQLDSTNTAYAALKLREQMVADSLNNAMDANAELQGQNTGLRQTIKKGQQLVIASSTIQAVRIANNGKERKTRRAKRTDQLNACITIAKNRIAAKGETILYAKWISPDGKPIDGPETNLAVVGGEMTNFNGSGTLNFTGEAKEICISLGRAVDAPVELESGVYTVALMTDSYLVGTASVELK